ncbi:hypothetical protein L9F63_025348, partial [Diploptera punctata]
MVFKKGGRTAASDNLKLGEEPIRMVNKFRYLGITLQPTTKSFSTHVQERAAAAIRAMCSIKDITSLKLVHSHEIIRISDHPDRHLRDRTDMGETIDQRFGE